MSYKEQDVQTNLTNPKFQRRKFVKVMGSAMATIPTINLLGCVAESSSSSSVISSSSEQASSSSLASSSSSSAATSSSEAAVVEGWAKGGTAGMWADFPPASPFSDSPACTVTGKQILGPCFFRPADYIREDISDGEVGLPTVYAFKVMDSSCSPMSGVVIDLWHTNCEGLYSDNRDGAVEIGPGYWDGSIPGLSCADNNARAKTTTWHRGAQITNSEGIVYFKSCFPYWYSGRTTHVHIRFIRDGMELLTTQFGFPDSLCNDVHLNHPEYSHVNEAEGKVQDRTMTTDPEFGSAGNDPKWLMDITKQNDGSLIAYKSIIIA